MMTSLARHLLLLLLLLLMPVAAVHAQQQPEPPESIDPPTGDSADDGNSTDDAQSDTGDTNTDLPDIDSQPIESSQNTGPGRFIPSEQISQDFGVSFPVDI